jgi:hypothetical protein
VSEDRDAVDVGEEPEVEGHWVDVGDGEKGAVDVGDGEKGAVDVGDGEKGFVDAGDL